MFCLWSGCVIKDGSVTFVLAISAVPRSGRAMTDKINKMITKVERDPHMNSYERQLNSFKSFEEKAPCLGATRIDAKELTVVFSFPKLYGTQRNQATLKAVDHQR